MKKVKIVFKNGEKQVVSLQIANKLRDEMLSGSKNIVSFTNTDSNVFFIINLLEVAFIIDTDYDSNKL
jgi:hypothetical protein